MKSDGSGPVSKQKRTNKDGTDSSDREEFEDLELTIAVLERDEGGPYGCGSCAPRFLQFCRRQPAALLTVLCVLELSSAYIQHGVMPAISTQLQRRFHFTAYDLASFRSSYDVGAFVCLIPVIRFGEDDIHRPQWIGFGGVITGLGALIMVTPHFMLDPYVPIETGDNVCGATKEIERCGGTAISSFKYLFMAGEFMIGVGTIPQFVMGVTYLDENITHRQSAIYTAIFSMCQLVGPVISFVVTSRTVLLPADMDKFGIEEAMRIAEAGGGEDFYGAWWLSILFGAIFSWIGAALVFPFPKQLSGATVAHIRDSREAMMTDHSGYHDPVTGEIQLTKKLKKILGNPVFMGVVMEQCFRSFMIGGFITFLPKYLEAAFDAETTVASLTTAKPRFLAGLAVVSTALLGLCLGTIVQHLFHLEVVGNLRLCLVGAFCALIFSAVFAVKCDPPPLAGVEQHYSEDSEIVGTPVLGDVCNENCSCEARRFDPVCYRPPNKTKEDRMDIMYFSMCFAGCKSKSKPTKNQTGFGFDCSCVPNNGPVIDGRCFTCNNRMAAFLVGLSWVGLSMYVRMNPVQQIMLRSVHFETRTTAIALASLLHRSVASIPAPFVFATVMDNACAFSIKRCGEKAQCGFFDRVQLSNAMTGTVIALGIVCLLSLLFALLSYRDPHLAPATSKRTKTSAKPKASKAATKAGVVAKKSKSPTASV